MMMNSELAPNMFEASSKPTSVMEFGFNLPYTNKLTSSHLGLQRGDNDGQ